VESRNCYQYLYDAIFRRFVFRKNVTLITPFFDPFSSPHPRQPSLYSLLVFESDDVQSVIAIAIAVDYCFFRFVVIVLFAKLEFISFEACGICGLYANSVCTYEMFTNCRSVFIPTFDAQHGFNQWHPQGRGGANGLISPPPIARIIITFKKKSLSSLDCQL